MYLLKFTPARVQRVQKLTDARPIDALTARRSNGESVFVQDRVTYRSVYVLVPKPNTNINELLEAHSKAPNFYEVVTAGPCAFYGDFDAKGSAALKLFELMPTPDACECTVQLLADLLASLLREHWPSLQQHDISVRHQTSTSHSDDRKKFSLHVVFRIIANGKDELSFDGVETVKALYSVLKETGSEDLTEAVCKLRDCMDGCVYHVHRNMRALYQSKRGKVKRPLLPLPMSSKLPTDHMIMASNSHVDVLPLLTLESMVRSDEVVFGRTGGALCGGRGNSGTVVVPPHLDPIAATLPIDVLTCVSQSGLDGSIYFSTRLTGPCKLFAGATGRTAHNNNHLRYVLHVNGGCTQLLQTCHGKHAQVCSAAFIGNTQVYAEGLHCIQNKSASFTVYATVPHVEWPAGLQAAVDALYAPPILKFPDLNLWRGDKRKRPTT